MLKWFVKESVWNKPQYRVQGMREVGWGNGYVCIPKTHPLYGVEYDHEDYDDIIVHGGLTFSARSDSLTDWTEIPEECRQDHWIVGFDTAHYMDGPAEWTKEAVEKEAMKLAKQLE